MSSWKWSLTNGLDNLGYKSDSQMHQLTFFPAKNYELLLNDSVWEYILYKYIKQKCNWSYKKL